MVCGEDEVAVALKVFLLNNYPVGDANVRASEGAYPAQHLWGMWELRKTFDWLYASRSLAGQTRGRPRLRSWVNRLMPLVGDPIQSFEAIRLRKQIDIVYAADQQSATGLLLLKRLGLFRKPIVVVVHNGPRLRWTWSILKSASAVIVLSPATQRLVEKRLPNVPAHELAWGPSLDSPIYQISAPAPRELHFTAAGKSNRDYSILRQVAIDRQMSGSIFSGTRIEHCKNGHWETDTRTTVSYTEILDHMRRSRWCVISVADQERLSGLTEAADALAVGTPVLANSRKSLPYTVGAVFFYNTNRELADALGSAGPTESITREAAQQVSMQAFSDGLQRILVGYS